MNTARSLGFPDQRKATCRFQSFYCKYIINHKRVKINDFFRRIVKKEKKMALKPDQANFSGFSCSVFTFPFLIPLPVLSRKAIIIVIVFGIIIRTANVIICLEGRSKRLSRGVCQRKVFDQNQREMPPSLFLPHSAALRRFRLPVFPCK